MHAFSIILEQVSMRSNLASYNVRRAWTSNVRYSMRASIARAPHIWLSFLLPSGVGIQLGASILSGRAGPGRACHAWRVGAARAERTCMLAAAMHANDDDWPYIWPAINIQCK